jgi:hypothetical protein
MHDSAILREEYDTVPIEERGIAWTKQRLDGFVSADADHKGGWLETPLLMFSGNMLRLNIDTGAMGTALVELRNAKHEPIPGYTLADCEEIGGNFIDQAVYWKGNTDLSALRGTPVHLYIELKRAKLFSFCFTGE